MEITKDLPLGISDSVGKVLFFGSAEEVVKGNVKVVRKFDQGGVVGLTFHIFITGDGVLIHVQVKSQL